jgi:hypothetical protein
MTKPEKTCYNPSRQAGAKKSPVVRRGLAGEEAVTPAMISEPCATPEMIAAVEWVLDEFEGEVSRATLVSEMFSAILGAAPASVRQALYEDSKNKEQINEFRRRRGEGCQ